MKIYTDQRIRKRRSLRTELLGRTYAGITFVAMSSRRLPPYTGDYYFRIMCRCGVLHNFHSWWLYTDLPHHPIQHPCRKCRSELTPADIAEWRAMRASFKPEPILPGDIVNQGRWVATNVWMNRQWLFRYIDSPEFFEWHHKYQGRKWGPCGFYITEPESLYMIKPGTVTFPDPPHAAYYTDRKKHDYDCTPNYADRPDRPDRPDRSGGT